MSGISEFNQIEKDTLVPDLLDFVEKELPSFTASDEFKNILTLKKNENQHSDSFCTYMTNRCASKYYFSREAAQKGSSTVDIAVRKGSIIIFVIEAKILPMPDKKSKSRVEHEYVYGKGAGIQRFKDENHGLDDSKNLLSESGMIAYIKENNFDHWLAKINDWIISAGWSEKEKLDKIYFNAIAKLKSTHNRKGNSNIILYHFWVNVSK